MGPRRRLLFEEEALASESDDEDEFEEDDDTSNSLDDFIVGDDDISDEEDNEFEDLNSDDADVVGKPVTASQQKGRQPQRKRKSTSSSSPGTLGDNTTTTTTPHPSAATTMMVGVSTPPPKPRDRPRSVVSPEARKPTNMKYANPPGHPNYPVNNFSLTISRLKQDVAAELLDVIHDFLTIHCIKSGLSTEVGHRAFNLHLQGTFSIRYPGDAAAVADLSKMIKEKIKATVLSLKGYRVVLKVLAKGQALSTMIGYITKDEGQPHYQVRLHSISRSDLADGRVEHTSMLSKFDDNKKVIHMKNFFNECFKFNKRCFAPLHRKISLEESSILWSMIHEPSSTTVEDIRELTFDPRTYDNRRTSNRYCQCPTRNQSNVESHSDNDALSFEIDRGSCLASQLVATMRAANVSTSLSADVVRNPPTSEENIVPLPSSRSHCLINGEEFRHCPSHLDEMVNYVRDVREALARSKSAIVSALLSDRKRHIDADQYDEDDDVGPGRSIKRSRNNYDMYCDLM